MKLRYWFIIIGVVLLSFAFYAQARAGGYSFSKTYAVQHAYPFTDGKIVSKRNFGANQVVVFKTSKGKDYLKLIERKFGILYVMKSATTLSSHGSLNSKMKIGWDAILSDNTKYYQTIFGAKVTDSNIKTVIVSNDAFEKQLSTLSEVKKNATFYKEIPVKNGYATLYSELPKGGVGNFVFRGLDGSGKIVSVIY